LWPAHFAVFPLQSPIAFPAFNTKERPVDGGFYQVQEPQAHPNGRLVRSYLAESTVHSPLSNTIYATRNWNVHAFIPKFVFSSSTVKLFIKSGD
jgi:hypothetical protein